MFGSVSINKQGVTMGRKSIEIKKIHDRKQRSVTFQKRRKGLLKKAMELSILCDCKVKVIVVDKDGQPEKFEGVGCEALEEEFADTPANLTNADYPRLFPPQKSPPRRKERDSPPQQRQPANLLPNVPFCFPGTPVMPMMVPQMMANGQAPTAAQQHMIQQQMMQAQMMQAQMMQQMMMYPNAQQMQQNPQLAMSQMLSMMSQMNPQMFSQVVNQMTQQREQRTGTSEPNSQPLQASIEPDTQETPIQIETEQPQEPQTQPSITPAITSSTDMDTDPSLTTPSNPVILAQAAIETQTEPQAPKRAIHTSQGADLPTPVEQNLRVSQNETQGGEYDTPTLERAKPVGLTIQIPGRNPHFLHPANPQLRAHPDPSPRKEVASPALILSPFSPSHILGFGAFPSTDFPSFVSLTPLSAVAPGTPTFGLGGPFVHWLSQHPN